MPLAVAVVLSLAGPRLAHAGRFAADSESYKEMAADGRAFVEKLAAAVDRSSVADLGKLVGEVVEVGGATYSREALVTAIKKHGGVRKAFGVPAGTWRLDGGPDDYHAYRGSKAAVFVVSRGSDGWRVREISDLSGGDAFSSVDLLHPPDPAVCPSVDPGGTLGTLEVSAGLDPAIVRRYVRRQLPRMRHCVEKQRISQPELAGTVTATFAIDADGKVIDAKATGSSDEVAACIRQTVAAMELPRPKDGKRVEVRQALVFGGTVGDFDMKVEACTTMPKDLIRFASRLIIAWDADERATFFASVPASLIVLGERTTKRNLTKAVEEAGSLRAWSGLASGAWTLEELEGVFTLHRWAGTRGAGLTSWLVLRKTRSGWQVHSVTDGCRQSARPAGVPGLQGAPMGGAGGCRRGLGTGSDPRADGR